MALDGANAIAEMLAKCGYSAWLVGGAVRDMAMDMPVSDIDIATDALPSDVLYIFAEAAVPSGLDYGTVTVLSSGQPFEVTSLRRELDYEGHHPRTVQFGADLMEDLARRDFTVNAMALPLPFDETGFDDKLIDMFLGAEDIKGRTIRAVGDPFRRIAEDPLRMLRAVRFAADLDFFVSVDLKQAIKEEAHRLSQISVERIRQELQKMLLPRKGRPSKALSLLEETGLLQYVSPALQKMVGCVQDKRWHAKDVWEHTLIVVDNVPDVLDLRLAALYHDVGKPSTQTFADEGKIHFYGHQEVSADIASEDLRRLTFPNKLIRRVELLCKEHMLSMSMKSKGMRRLYMRLSEAPDADADEMLFSLFQLYRADIKGTAKPERIRKDLEVFDDFVARFLDAIDVPSSNKDAPFELAINGFDIMEKLGIEGGPKVGAYKDALVDWVLEEPKRNNRRDLLHQLFLLQKELVQARTDS